jgi:hypothetical protein
LPNVTLVRASPRRASTCPSAAICDSSLQFRAAAKASEAAKSSSPAS